MCGFILVFPRDEPKNNILVYVERCVCVCLCVCTCVCGMGGLSDSHVLKLAMSVRPAVSDYPAADAGHCKSG